MSKITDSCYGGVDAYCKDLDHKKKIQEKLEFKKHLYHLKEKGVDLVKKNGKVYERYIDSIKVDGLNFMVGHNSVVCISVRDKPHIPFKIILTYDDESKSEFVNYPAAICYALKEVRPIESEEE